MNERVRTPAVFFLALSIVSATLAGTATAQTAQPGEPAPGDAPPPAGDLSAPPASPPTITTPTNAPAATPAYPTATSSTMMAPVAAPPPPPTTVAPVKIDSPSTTIKFGFLAQPQYEAFGSLPVGGVEQDGLTQNLYLRRTRLLVGGTLFGVLDYFFDTDFANLFRSTGGGSKNTPGMNIQDAFVTYKPLGDLLKVDAGYMLPPLSHNAVQGAGSLYSWDYFNYTFQHNNQIGGMGPFGFNAGANPVGRDAGLQLRGLVLDGHIEYRAGLFQGVRNQATGTEVGGRNFFRATARLQINLLDAEPGFFYAGTYFGAKKILSVGGSFDVQANYKYWAADLLADLPLGPGVFTAQVNFAQWNASNAATYFDNETVAAPTPIIPKQTALMAEAGYTIPAFHVSPILRYEQLWSAAATGPDEKRVGGGVAFWPYLHNSNVKVFYTRLIRDGVDNGVNQVNVQWQVYFF